MASLPPTESSESSEPQQPTRRVTLRDIATEVGVTPMTVSRALRNQARISEAMRTKIQAKAIEMGYHPDPVLTALVHYRHNRMEAPVRASMAWFNPWADPAQLRKFREFDFYWKGAKAAAERFGFNLEEFIVNEAMTPARMAQILYTRNVRGILLPPGLFPDGWADQFPWAQFSVVAISRSTVGLPFHVVTSDQASNAMLAVRKIREHGYKRIGLISEAWIGRNYCAGYLWLQQLEIPAELRVPLLLLDLKKTADEIQADFSRWMRDHKPDAILTDYGRVPEMIAKLGLKVPGDMGLAALTVLDCPIDTGIYQNSEEVGRVAVLMLQSLINDNDRGIPPVNRHVLVEGSWVEGSMMRQTP